MTISAIFILDQNGKPIITRNYRGDISLSCHNNFRKHLKDDERYLKPPIYTEDGINYLYVFHNNIYILAVSRNNSNAMTIICFLYKIIEVLQEYFNKLEEESIRDNFVLIYELLDEMLDFGYPQTTSAKVLKDYICVSEKHTLHDIKPPSTVTNAVNWRVEGIKHSKNEVFLDVVEKLNVLSSCNGSVLHSEIIGSLLMKSYLSGMPELKLGLNDRLLFSRNKKNYNIMNSNVKLDDIKFHQCVRLSKFDSDRTISFIPPDGDFELMSYRLDTNIKPLFNVTSTIETHSHSRIEYLVKVRSEYRRRTCANNVILNIPVPINADSPKFDTKLGYAKYAPENNCFKWTISSINGQQEMMMRAHFGLPTISDDKTEGINNRPIKISFEIPYYTVSGIQIRYLKIIEKSGYLALPWVRYITKNGNYQIRINN